MLQFVRAYASPPQFKRSGNLLWNALTYVQEVDQYQDKIVKESPEKDLATQLVSRIEGNAELLSLLLLFHHELDKLGITPTLQRTFSGGQVWRYRAAYATRLAKIHNIFWDQCRLLEVAKRNHLLGFRPDRIGVLDPAHFDVDDYTQLQAGIFRGTDFRGVEIMGPSRFWLQKT